MSVMQSNSENKPVPSPYRTKAEEFLRKVAKLREAIDDEKCLGFEEFIEFLDELREAIYDLEKGRFQLDFYESPGERHVELNSYRKPDGTRRWRLLLSKRKEPHDDPKLFPSWEQRIRQWGRTTSIDIDKIEPPDDSELGS